MPVDVLEESQAADSPRTFGHTPEADRGAGPGGRTDAPAQGMPTEGELGAGIPLLRMDQVGMPPAICESRLLTALQTSRNCLENCVMLFTASVNDLLKFA